MAKATTKTSSTPKVNTAKKPASEKLPLGKRYATQFRKMANKVGGHRIAKAPTTSHASIEAVQREVEAAAALLAGIAEKLDALPENFKARKAGGYQPKVVVGAVVEIAEKRRNLYPETLIAHTGLKVVDLAGTKVVVTNGDGSLRTMLPRNHIKVTEQAAA